MIKRKTGLFVLLPVLCISCLHSRTAAPSFPKSAGVIIYSGRASVKIYGQANENLYSENIFDASIKDQRYYDNPVIRERTVTKNETKEMAAGDEYKFSILPAEVVTLTITSLDGNDVEIMVYQNGRENKHTVKGANILGLSIAFQNR